MANPSSLSDFVRMSAVDDLSYPLACDDRTRDAVNTIVSGRKSWKTLKGKGEAVWPPYLEAALIEGAPPPLSSPPLLTLAYPLAPSLLPALDKYRPETSRSTRSLSRFPNRNRFISDYIYHVTGKRRTAKQVGSRLQQLRDTCGGKRSQYFRHFPLLHRAHASVAPLQFSSFYLTVISRLLPRRMRFHLPWKMHTFQMAPLLAHLPRNVLSPSVDMRRSAPPARSFMSMCSRQMHLGLHQTMLVS
jgi:TEA/ATTS domain